MNWIKENKLAALVILLIAAVLIVISVFLWQKRSVEPEVPHIVTSQDGTASLSVPRTALPKGVTLQDISIAKLSPEEYSEAIAVLEPFTVYRLEPDGTQFQEPVEFSVTVDAGDDEYYPNALHFMEDSVESIDNLQVEKLENKTFVMKGSVKHFSDIGVLNGFFAIDMPANLGRHLVGESFVVPVTIKKRNAYDTDDSDKSVMLLKTLTTTPQFTNGEYDAFNNVVSPSHIPDKPPKGTLLKSDAVTIQGSFTCVREGEDKIEYDAIIFYKYQYIHLLKGSTEAIFSDIETELETKGRRATVVCFVPTPTPTPSITPPPPTPTPTPPLSPPTPTQTPLTPTPKTSCNIPAFQACANTFNLQGCIDACPMVPIECPAGTPPNSECKETDQNCSDGCWNTADTHIEACLIKSNCTKEEVIAGGGGAQP